MLLATAGAVGVCERDCKITNFCPLAVGVPVEVLPVPSIIGRPVGCCAEPCVDTVMFSKKKNVLLLGASDVD